MRKLTNVSLKIWIFLGCILTISAFTIIFILNYKIESTMDIVIRPSLSENIVFVSDEDAFKLKIDDRISIVINKKYYDVTIKEIRQEDEKFLLVLNERLPFFGENVNIPAKAIYEEETIANMLFKHI